MDATKWTQGFQENIGLVKPMEEIVPNTCTHSSNNNNKQPMLERKARPQEHLNCPRCNSNNTKFCYYNNYSLTQPRYFCKTCRRYWTEGGSLRNVPVGGGSRKNKRPLTSSSASSTSSAPSKLPDLNPSFSQFVNPQNPNNKTQQNKGQDLNLSFQVMHETNHHHHHHHRHPHDHMSQYASEVPKAENNENSNNNNNNSCLGSYNPNPSQISALDLLRSSGISSRGLNSFVPVAHHDIPTPDDSAASNNTMFSSGFPLQDMKPNLGFSIDGLGNRFGGSVHGVHQENMNGGKLFFPFGDHLKQIPTTTTTSMADHQNKEQSNSTGYWSGMIGGGGSW